MHACSLYTLYTPRSYKVPPAWLLPVHACMPAAYTARTAGIVYYTVAPRKYNMQNMQPGDCW